MARRRTILIVAASVTTISLCCVATILLIGARPDPLADYGEEISPIIGMWAEGFDQFSLLADAASKNTALMSDDEWAIDMGEGLVTIKLANARLREIDVPDEAQEAHDALLDVASELDTMVLFYAEGMGLDGGGKVDRNKFMAGMEAMRRSRERFTIAYNLFQDLFPELR